MLLRRTFILLFLSVIIFSCNTDNDTVVPEITPKEYSFVKMEFRNTTQSDDSELFEILPDIIISNRTDITQSYNHYPFKGIFETSKFSGLDTAVLNHIVNPQLISVPNSTGYLGKAKWHVSVKTETSEPDMEMHVISDIGPNTMMTIKYKIYYRTLTADTRLILIDQDENEFVLEGTWTGVVPFDTEIKTLYEEL